MNMLECTRPVRVLLADEHTLLRHGVAELLSADQRVEVVAEATNGSQTIEIVRREKPDVVLINDELPDMTVEETLCSVKGVSQETRAVVFCARDYEPAFMYRLIRSGVIGFLTKTATREELLSVVLKANSECDRVLVSLPKPSLHDKIYIKHVLSPREVEVLSLAAEAYSNSQISSHLYISPSTVKRHFTNIYAKLEVSSRVEAINYARTNNLISRTVHYRDDHYSVASRQAKQPH